MKKLTILTMTLALLFVACDKDKRASKRFMRPGTWQVTKLMADGNTYPIESLKWTVQECSIYEELCMGEWHLGDKNSQFYWQFNEKAQTFTLSRVVAPEDCEDFYTEEVEQMTYLFSGEYNVIESKRKSKIFESSETIGFNGNTVRIEMEWE
jgi:hypothetical protein